MKKNILLIGVGGTGSNAVDTFFKKYEELGNQTENKVTALVFDTDAGDLKRITSAKTVAMADSASVGTICDRVGKQYLREWFPCDAKDVRAQEMVRGASQWRKKSYLAFLNLMNKPAERSVFISALEEMVQDPSASNEIYVIASVAGGTGSGSFIQIALYAKRYLRKNLGKDPIVNAMIALPDIYADKQTPENKVKVFSNAYAILRELNAINLVARNYNADNRVKKKAPIKFKIGHENEPNVGVLFDASDSRFWTPEAAPFNQVFLLDRIPCVDSIQAHDMVLANSLYTIICTEIGAAFDSEFSNHELVRSQNNGSNAIYASISNSRIRFPHQSVLEYLAYTKTSKSCEDEWLTVHKAVESTIQEKEREAKAAKRRYVMKDSEYAELVLQTVERLQDEDHDEVSAVVERCVTIYDKDGKPTDATAGENYIKMIEDYIKTRIPDSETFKTSATEQFPKAKSRQKPTHGTVRNLIKETLPTIMFGYFQQCYDAVLRYPTSISDSIITLEKKKIGTIADKYALEKNLLKTDNGQNIHPVAALIRLCQFRVELAKKLARLNHVKEWPELRKRSITTLPSRFYSNLDTSDGKSIDKSAYAALGEGRFENIFNDSDNTVYSGKRTKVAIDLEVLKSDSNAIISKIAQDTTQQIRAKVFRTIAADIDILIDKYRAFFNRFSKEKAELDVKAKDAKSKDSGLVNTVINVYSSEEDKDRICKDIDESNGPATESDILATDNIVGKGVLESVFASAIAEKSDDEDYNENDVSDYRSLFNKMVDAYRDSIKKSEKYKIIESYNVIEAVKESCGISAGDKEVDSKKKKLINDKLREIFRLAQEKATPSLKVEANSSEKDLVTPSDVTVFMLSLNTAKYIKTEADLLGLTIPDDEYSESAMIRAFADEFIKDYSGNSSARIAIVDSIPDSVIYCTGETMDITPLCIAKFNELGEDNIYFKNYTDALYRHRNYDTDMWNPHIGNDLYKRGYLPYMNPEMEDACDEKMVKALLYAFSHKMIRYTDSVGGATSKGKYYFVCGASKILGQNNQPISIKNLAQLLNWLRNENDKIELWSAAFDRDIEAQKLALPTVITDNELPVLERELTNSDFMKMLNGCLFINNQVKYAKKADEAEDGEDVVDDIDAAAENTAVKPEECKECEISATEFAYRIKVNEEIVRDCDDAERILRVLYKVFLDLVSFRVSPDNNPEQFTQVYHQQLEKFYTAFAGSEVITNAKESCENQFGQLVEWLNTSGLFMDINLDYPFGPDGKVAIAIGYDYQKSKDIPAFFKKVKANAKATAGKKGKSKQEA